MEHALRRTLTTSVVLRAGKLRDAAARVDFNPQPPHDIVVDPHQSSLLEGVIHELIHVAYRSDLERWGYLEEPIVMALEDQMVRHINRNPKRAEWWRARIAERLA